MTRIIDDEVDGSVAQRRGPIDARALDPALSAEETDDVGEACVLVVPQIVRVVRIVSRASRGKPRRRLKRTLRGSCHAYSRGCR